MKEKMIRVAKRCPHCGQHLGRMADGSNKCPHCGMPIVENTEDS